MTVTISADRTRALVLDIEGTTTPIEFVYQVLFPFARAHASEYLARNQESTVCREVVALLRQEYAADPLSDAAQDSGPAGADAAPDFSPAVALRYIDRLMDQDRKSPGLKALQGLIWQNGYNSGELRGQVFPDVAPAFKRWRARGLDIYIYSSGSVLAQRLLFGSTTAGDLTTFLKGYFDTAVGSKASPDSYVAIAARVQIPPPKILFVSDVVDELDAARRSGMQTALCVRGGEPASGTGTHPVIRSFDAIVE